MTVEIPRENLSEDLVLLIAQPRLHESSPPMFNTADGSPAYLTDAQSITFASF